MPDKPINTERETSATIHPRSEEVCTSSLSVNAEAVKDADIVWAVGPDPEWILVYAQTGGVNLNLVAAAEKTYPSHAKVLCVPCRTNAEVDVLCALVDSIKGSK